MTDPKEFNSLDELFRKTFEDLPDTPAPSGWDAPSPQVWNEVRVRLKPPRSGWSTQALMLVSGLAVVLFLGLYWVLTRPGQPEITRNTEQPTVTTTLRAPQESTTMPATEQSETIAVQPSVATTPPLQSSGKNEVKNQPNAPAISPSPNSTERPAEEPGRVRPTGSAPLPGWQPASPNTTVRRQTEAWRNAPWAKPLAPLPSLLETRIIRQVPQGLKDISNPKQEH